MNICELNPTNIWNHFNNICAIPHPSKHEEQLRQYIISFAQKNNLEFKTDKIGNIVILKPATPDKLSTPVIAMQAHLDMVPQKNSDKVHNFLIDPIIPQIDGDWLKATGTTLGADNGIGVACMLAVLESQTVSHGPLECLFTIDEEAGMTGASELDPTIIKAKTLLNLDSEQEGDIYVGCAGGLDGVFSYSFTQTLAPEDHISLLINLKGLRGGHSGLDINLGRGNANKLLARIILEIDCLKVKNIHSFKGGNLRNAIPREAAVELCIPKSSLENVEQSLKQSLIQIQNEYGVIEPKICIEHKTIEKKSQMILESEFILHSIYACPHGVVAMNSDLLDLVETSTNLAIVNTTSLSDTEGKFTVESFMRSSSESGLNAVRLIHKSYFSIINYQIEFKNGYSGWKPNMNSPILKLATDVFIQMNEKKPSVKAIHAGLETGYFTKHFPGMDMISIGPTIKFPHSPDEKVSISSVGHFWDYLVKILKEFK